MASKWSKASQFIGEVRTEMSKVTWPERREVTLTTAFVFILAVIAALYFCLVDQMIVRLIRLVVGSY